MPVDPFHGYAALRMEVDDAPDEMNDAHVEAWDILSACSPEGAILSSSQRHAFYKLARQCFAIVQSGESRPCACFVLRKGVIT